MSFIKRWDVADISRQINTATAECSSPYNDGFVCWGIKQDLYQIKYLLDEALKRCPSFAGEDEWLREQEQKKIIKILKEEIK